MGDRKCLPTVLALPMLVDPDDLRATLKRLRLRLPAVVTIGFSAASTHRTLSLDAYLTLLIWQGFLDRQQPARTRREVRRGSARRCRRRTTTRAGSRRTSGAGARARRAK
jgi:hypothetical protein